MLCMYGRMIISCQRRNKLALRGIVLRMGGKCAEFLRDCM